MVRKGVHLRDNYTGIGEKVKAQKGQLDWTAWGSSGIIEVARLTSGLLNYGVSEKSNRVPDHIKL